MYHHEASAQDGQATKQCIQQLQAAKSRACHSAVTAKLTHVPTHAQSKCAFRKTALSAQKRDAKVTASESESRTGRRGSDHNMNVREDTEVEQEVTPCRSRNGPRAGSSA